MYKIYTRYQFIKIFKETSIYDVDAVGGKSASLGEMITQLSSKGIGLPDGFATTAFAFRNFPDFKFLWGRLNGLLRVELDYTNYSNLKEISEKIRMLILQATMPGMTAAEIANAYKELRGDVYFEVTVCSSATAEDLP